MRFSAKDGIPMDYLTSFSSLPTAIVIGSHPFFEMASRGAVGNVERDKNCNSISRYTQEVFTIVFDMENRKSLRLSPLRSGGDNTQNCIGLLKEEES